MTIDWRTKREDETRRRLRRTLLTQFVTNGYTAQRILDSTELTDDQTTAMKAVVAASQLLASALD